MIGISIKSSKGAVAEKSGFVAATNEDVVNLVGSNTIEGFPCSLMYSMFLKYSVSNRYTLDAAKPIGLFTLSLMLLWIL